MTNKANGLGLVFLPREGTPVGRMQFTLHHENAKDVEIGTPVAADTEEGVVIGTVDDMRTVGRSNEPTPAYLESYQPGRVTLDDALQVANVQLFHTPKLRPVTRGVVRAATAEEMKRATGYHEMDWPIPAGAIPLADGTLCPVALEGTNLAGPEAGHMMVLGLSGQASKTSYSMTLLKSIIHAGNPEHRVAAIVFNLKGEDLIWLDQPPAAGYELQDTDHAIYEALGTPATPFDNVTVYSPALPGGSQTRSPRHDAQLLRWPLLEVWRYLKYLLPDMYADEKLASFWSQFYDEMLNHPDPSKRIESFRKLQDWFEWVLEDEEKPDGKFAPRGWRSHHPATLRRIHRMLEGVVARCQGLITREGSQSYSDLPVTALEHGEVHVVDVAGMSNDVKALVIARSVERLLKSAEEGTLGVDHLVVFVDELNEYAPAQGAEMASVRKILQKVSTQGRYAGVSLWGAAQKGSKIDEMVRDNAATMAVGRSVPAELATGVLGRLNTGLSERIATLPKGAMVLFHHTYRSPLLVRFPRPAWKTGRPSTSGASGHQGGVVPARPSSRTALGLSPDAFERITAGMSEAQVDNIVASADDKGRALAELERARIPDLRLEALPVPPRASRSPFDLDD